MALFYELDIEHPIMRALDKMGFTEATPIQEKVIPFGKQKQDIIGQAQTGTGKTVAFGIPCIEQLELEEKHPQALVLTPTRELAIQVAEELNKLGQFKGIRALPIYGGQDISRQITALKKRPQIIVATPGRYMDHMRRKTIRPEYLKVVILDEADEMLSMGFIEDIETILQEVPEERHTMLFSATMPPKLKNIADRFMQNPVSVKVEAKQLTVENIDQRYILSNEKDKFDVLCNLLDMETPELAIIFGRTKRRVDELTESLSIRGFDVDGLHGDMKQERRDQVIRKFKRGSIEVMVATDVAARGLDVNNVTHVINFDLPQDAESYVHRIGRTGRAGKKGISYSFVTYKEKDHLAYIEQETKKRMTQVKAPTYADALSGRHEQAVEILKDTINNAEVGDLEASAKKLLLDYDPVTLVSAALKLVTKEPSKKPVKITGEAPVRSKNKPRREGGKGGGQRRNRDRDRDRGRRGERGRAAGGALRINTKKRTKKDRDRAAGRR
ncbi:ATP-dependent RNA helicase DeaD [Evansella caseinilytica]|uniref:ATP-dependent RNA helicase DeaD n=1 Tax=Evansella caseinilytica TaxID=1503961 RepID=A0A1H3GSC2_9BACI|nr:DEAD/DEAH box helicase [Evansella caseinilytica]SDY06226.1 ATP-dependent RNA helicase DeaD [Evansella caseinilytica]